MDDANAARILIHSEQALGDLTPPMIAIAGEIDDRVQNAFEVKADPVTGAAWPELKPATVKARVRKGYNATDILQRTRILRTGVIAEPDARGVSVTAGAVEYAKVHQYGAPGKNIPQRRFAGVSPADLELFEKIIVRHISGP